MHIQLNIKIEIRACRVGESPSKEQDFNKSKMNTHTMITRSKTRSVTINPEPIRREPIRRMTEEKAWFKSIRAAAAAPGRSSPEETQRILSYIFMNPPHVVA